MNNLSCLNDNDLKRLEEIKNSLDFASELFDYNLEPHDSTILINVLREYDHRLERLNNIIKRLETDLYNMYITFGEFSEEYTEKRIKELKGSDKGA